MKKKDKYYIKRISDRYYYIESKGKFSKGLTQEYTAEEASILTAELRGRRVPVILEAID